tara:strand:- start:35748 stop:36125 length:378 start_codon:yes stop_codon:yes gene_type:complete
MKLNYYFKFFIFFILIVLSKNSFSKSNINEKVKDLTLELRCMTCQNQSVYDSDSEFAKDITNLVIEKFNKGLSEAEIKVFLTERYGEYILFKPYFSIKNMALWLFPFILLFLSLVFLLKNLKKTK